MPVILVECDPDQTGAVSAGAHAVRGRQPGYCRKLRCRLYLPLGQVAVGLPLRSCPGPRSCIAPAQIRFPVLDQLLIGLVPTVGRWTMGGATAGLLQLGSSATTRGDLLPAWGGGSVLLAYTAVIWLLARTMTNRRDLP